MEEVAMIKKCKYCGKDVNVSLFGFNSDVYCPRHSLVKLSKWRKGKFPDWNAKEYPQTHAINDSSIQIIWKNQTGPDYKYCKIIDETLRCFANERDSLFMLDTVDSKSEKCIKITKYDYESGCLHYCDFDDPTIEKAVYIFDIYKLRRVYKKEWVDIKAYKVFYRCVNGTLHSKGDQGMTFHVGHQYDEHIDCEGKSDRFFETPYYDSDGCEDDDVPFRFYMELSHVFELADLIKNPLQKELRLYHIQAYKAGRLTHGSNNWAAKKIEV